MRRGSIVQLVVLGILFGAGAAAVALLVPWLPDPASEQADRIDFVFWFVTAICIAIFALVAAVIVYAVINFRASPDDDEDGPPTHGNTGLEIAWTAVPAALVTAISIVSAVVLAKNEQLPSTSSASAASSAQKSTVNGLCKSRGGDPLQPLVVCVIAQQFTWLFKYPDFGNATSSTLRLPIHKTVQLQLQSLDVIHSFWVPQFGQKQDAVPGLLTKLVITPKRLGTFPVICTELCGLGHALMRSESMVLTGDKFAAWTKSQQRGATGAGGAAASSGKALFVSNGCNGCHTFKPAGANGTVGPDLDKLAAFARQAGQPLDKFIRESIVNPDAYVAPGYQKGVMPGTFASLPPAQLDALVKYLEGSK
ncbi:MAG TPA: cytochrome c oxidase subunit II [Gaiellaceae bacterium]|nr:cytochrome c oxidase subunit II [Gaiellaceae bacterium]